mmetsp:Transcript_3514/g.6737  ORF Transcript_3514/g.6737 Transcript_3514/m.6737 type:complete len:273 (+) Transcript_3514:65-883(+)
MSKLVAVACHLLAAIPTNTPLHAVLLLPAVVLANAARPRNKRRCFGPRDPLASSSVRTFVGCTSKYSLWHLRAPHLPQGPTWRHLLQLPAWCPLLKTVLHAHPCHRVLACGDPLAVQNWLSQAWWKPAWECASLIPNRRHSQVPAQAAPAVPHHLAPQTQGLLQSSHLPKPPSMEALQRSMCVKHGRSNTVSHLDMPDLAKTPNNLRALSHIALCGDALEHAALLCLWVPDLGVPHHIDGKLHCRRVPRRAPEHRQATARHCRLRTRTAEAN